MSTFSNHKDSLSVPFATSTEYDHRIFQPFQEDYTYYITKHPRSDFINPNSLHIEQPTDFDATDNFSLNWKVNHLIKQVALIGRLHQIIRGDNPLVRKDNRFYFLNLYMVFNSN